MNENSKPLADIRKLVADLRGENGCPWDRKQTPESMRVYLVEEMYELLDAMDSGESKAVAEELGDVLFQLFFLARIYEERSEFDINDVAEANTKKMIARHPHVFGDEKARTAEDVRAKWYQYKKNELKTDDKKGFLDSIPKSLPALMRAYRVCERTSRVQFHRPPKGRGIEQLDMEWEAYKQAAAANDKQATADALGKFLFDLAGMARRQGVHPETALIDATEDFSNRFSHMEKQVTKNGKDLDETPPEEMEAAFKYK